MLWISEHAPEGFDDLPQEELQRILPRADESGLNVVLHGPAGAGKTAAARLFGDDEPYVLNASDFFGMTKDEIADDPRFRGFVSASRKRDSSKADIINHILKEVASHTTVGEGRRTVVLDNAEETRRDFQQALRRVMERYSDRCRFVLTTRSLSSLIPAIRSRGLPVAVRQSSKEERVEALGRVAEREGVEADDEGLEYAAEEADDLREAVLLLQAASASADDGAVTMSSVYDVADEIEEDGVPEMLDAATSGDFEGARDAIDDLLIDEGWSGRDVLRRVLEETDDPRVVEEVGETDVSMHEGANDRIHLERLASSIPSDR